MNLVKSLFLKVLSPVPGISFSLWGCLTIAAFLSGASAAFFDIQATSLFFRDGGSYRLAFDLIVSAFMMPLIGRFVLTARRRKGMGSFGICFVGVCFTAGLIFFAMMPGYGGADLLFITRYALWPMVITAFWSMASRTVPLKIDSLKCVVLFCAQLTGILIAGWGNFLWPVSPLIGLWISLGGMGGFVLLLGIMTYLMPIQAEAFIHRGGGARDAAARRLTDAVAITAYVVWMIKCVADYVFWMSFWSYAAPEKLTDALGVFWGTFGTLGFLMLFFLYRTRYLHTTRGGIGLFLLSVFALSGGAFLGAPMVVLGAYTVFCLTFHLYVQQYLMMLPEILTPGRGVRLRTLRTLVAEPVGFLTGALSLFFLPGIERQSIVLAGLGCVAVFVFGRASILYSQLLLDSFRVRLWRGNTLMIMSSRLSTYVHKELMSADADDTIYFLKILEYAKHPHWQKTLLKALRHESSDVRIFVLQRISRLINVHDFYKTIERTYEKDPDPRVRQEALALMIELAAHEGKTADFVSLLDKRDGNQGALIGFLKAGGDFALLAMDGLQKLIAAKRKSAHLKALEIITRAPLPGLVRLVIPFLKSSDPEIACKALICAGEMRHPALLPDIFKAITDERLSEAALIALNRYGKRAFPPIEKVLHQPQGNALLQKRLILFLSMLKSGEGKQILIRALHSPRLELRRDILKALIDARIVWVQKDKKTVLTRELTRDAARAVFLNEFIRRFLYVFDPDAAEALTSLRHAFIKDIMVVREVILYQLMFFKDDELMHRACRILMRRGAETGEQAAALGLIQDLIPARLYRILSPVLRFEKEEVESSAVTGVPKKELLTALMDLILKPPFLFDDWEKALIFYALRRLGDPMALAAVQVGLKEPGAYVLEAAILTLIRLEPDKQRAHDMLLSVPTSRLVGQALELISQDL